MKRYGMMEIAGHIINRRSGCVCDICNLKSVVSCEDLEKARQQLKKALCGYEPDCVKKVKQCLMCERIDKVLE